MTRDEALALQAELQALLGTRPGGITDRVRNRLKEIELAFRWASADPYLGEKVFKACEYLEIWLSPRKWRKYGANPSRLQALVSGAVHNLEQAIGESFPAPPGGGPDGPTR
jgi:hypothetical protein